MLPSCTTVVAALLVENNSQTPPCGISGGITGRKNPFMPPSCIERADKTVNDKDNEETEEDFEANKRRNETDLGVRRSNGNDFYDVLGRRPRRRLQA